MNADRISAGRWFWLLLVTLLFLHFFVFIQLPVSIYLESEALDSGVLPAIVTNLLFLGLASVLLLALVLGVLGWPLRKFLAPVLLALALSYWIIDSFFRRNYPPLDGALTELPPDAAYGWVQLLVFAAVLAILWLGRRRLEVPVLVFLSALLLLNAFWTVRSLWRLPEPAGREQAMGADEFFTLSRKRNVLIVLMDTFQSEYLEEVLASRPDLAAGLEGFSYFPDTLGVATSTFMSVPAIHSGNPYEPNRTMSAYFNESIRRESLLARLGKAGYRTILLNPIRNVCPEQAQCLNRDQLLRSEWKSTFAASLHMLDISLMRSAPEPLKNAVFNHGAFRVAQYYSPTRLAGDSLVVWDDSRVLQQYGDRLKPGAEQAYAVFLHLMNTHPPYVLGEDCEVAAGEGHDRGSRGSAIRQATCGIVQFVSLMKSLQSQGLYDQTMVVLAGDHGSSSVYADPSLASRRLLAGPANPDYAPRLVGSANPLLLVKPFAANGPLQVSPRRAELTDIPATICGALAECEWQTGVNLFATEPPAPRQRRFMHYRWEHNFWEMGHIPELEFYTVAGPIAQWSSWQLEADMRRESMVQLSFTETDDPAIFGVGWGDPEISPQGDGVRWITGHRAELVLPVQMDSPAGRIYQLNLGIWVPDFNPSQSITLELNGHPFAEEPLKPGMHMVKYRIPPGQVVSGNNHIVLHFASSKRVSEEDVRSLTVVMKSLTFEKIEIER